MTAWRRATRWLMLALACVALGASAVPARAMAQVDVAAQVELAARKATRARQARTVRAPAAARLHTNVLPKSVPAPRLPALVAQGLPAPPGRIYLTHRALLR